MNGLYAIDISELMHFTTPIFLKYVDPYYVPAFTLAWINECFFQLYCMPGNSFLRHFNVVLYSELNLDLCMSFLKHSICGQMAIAEMIVETSVLTWIDSGTLYIQPRI